MKCPTCGSTSMTFLGMWYHATDAGHILQSHYGCIACRTVHRRPVDENVYYYVREGDRDIIVRPTHVPLKHERRLPIVNLAPEVFI